jgi:cold shock CspA family protein
MFNKKGVMQMFGTVKVFNTSKSFGFITPDAGGKDFFCTSRHCVALAWTVLRKVSGWNSM